MHLELLDHLTTERSLRKHAAHGATNRIFWLAAKQRAVCLGAQTTGVTAVVVHEFRLGLAAGEHHLGCIDDHDVITGVHVCGKDRLVLAAQDARYFGAHATEHQTIGIDKMPLALDVFGLRGKGTHLHYFRTFVDEPIPRQQDSSGYGERPTVTIGHGAISAPHSRKNMAHSGSTG